VATPAFVLTGRCRSGRFFYQNQIGMSDIERPKHSLQPRLESAHPHERYHARSKAPWIGGNLIKVGKRFGEFRRRFANHRHWHVTEFRLLSEHGQESLDHAQRESIADNDAVDVAQVEMTGGCFDAQRASNLDTLAHRNTQRRIKRATAGDEHGGIIKRIADRQQRQSSAARCE
jgi:hypothetical protein